MARSPIVSVLGHVDHGKSSILDAIRESNIIATEAGAITQAIGASKVPLESIKKLCGELLEKLNMKLTIPGLLFIDTPGHAAFTSLRKRGGALADIAILVVDINEGFKPQTIEAIEILRNTKTPFVLAANKLDLVPGYSRKHNYLLKDISSQSPAVQTGIEKRMYEIVGQIHENFKMEADRYDRVSDFTKQVAIVPCSAMKKIGIPELLMVVTGLAQRFLSERLKVDVEGPAKGTVLEVKEEKGLGTTLDVIIYDGALKVNDTIVIGSLDEPIVTKVRALLEPAPLSEMRDRKSEFVKVREVQAATGVKISAPGMEAVLAGMPVLGAGGDIEAARKKVQEQVKSVLIETGERGIIVKADSIGSLEALLQMLKERNISVARAGVGGITKKDLAAADASAEREPLHGVILGFNISPAKADVKVITGDIIYRIIDDFEEWQASQKKAIEGSELEGLVRPCRIEFLKNHTFRQSGPAIFGVEVLAGILKTGTALMKEDGSVVGMVRSMQEEQDSVQSAGKGSRLAISVPNITVGRQVDEGNVLLSDIPEKDFRKLKEMKQYLSEEEISIMKEIASLKRKSNPVWGV